MKRQRFHLGSVLRLYELNKQRTEYDLQRTSSVLQATDREIQRLEGEVIAVSALLSDNAATLSTAGWVACYRKTDYLGKTLAAVRERRIQEAAVLKELEAARRSWSIKEETLLSLKRGVESYNHDQAEKAQQEILDETVLRQWSSGEQGLIHES